MFDVQICDISKSVSSFFLRMKRVPCIGEYVDIQGTATKVRGKVELVESIVKVAGDGKTDEIYQVLVRRI